jgi:hypothetical protein
MREVEALLDASRPNTETPRQRSTGRKDRNGKSSIDLSRIARHAAQQLKGDTAQLYKIGWNEPTPSCAQCMHCNIILKPRKLQLSTHGNLRRKNRPLKDAVCGVVPIRAKPHDIIEASLASSPIAGLQLRAKNGSSLESTNKQILLAPIGRPDCRVDKSGCR